MSSVGSAAAVASQGHWAARYNTWLVIALTLKGVVFSFLLFSFFFYQTVMMGWDPLDVMPGLQMLSCCIVGLSVGVCHPHFAFRCCSAGRTCYASTVSRSSSSSSSAWDQSWRCLQAALINHSDCHFLGTNPLATRMSKGICKQ